MPLSLLPPQPVCAITTSAASNRAQNLLIGFPPREREKKRLLARHDISVRARADIFLRANADDPCLTFPGWRLGLLVVGLLFSCFLLFGRLLVFGLLATAGRGNAQ